MTLFSHKQYVFNRAVIMKIFVEKMEEGQITSVEKCLKSRRQFRTDYITDLSLDLVENLVMNGRGTRPDLAKYSMQE